MMDEFILSFMEEAREMLARLENDLLLLEQGHGDREVTDRIFRVMHNLKGASRMYGFEEIQNLSHEFEGIFEKIRSGQLCVSKDLINDTLKAKDLLLLLLEKDLSPVVYQDFLQYLGREYTGGQTGEKVYEKPENATAGSARAVFCILFKPGREVFERGLNPDRALEDIKAAGKSRIILHEGGIPWDEQKASKTCLASWEIYLDTRLTACDLEEIFLFYDRDEYRVIDLSDGYPDGEEELREFYRQMHPGVGLADHMQACLHELRLDKEAIPAADAGEPENLADLVPADPGKTAKDSIIGVSSAKLDELMNLVSELVISTAALDAHAARLNDLRLSNHIEVIEKLTKKFRSNALDLRLIPVGTLLNKFNRQVRDLSTELEKRVVLYLQGQETEIDKTILRSIESPLMHIVRNSIDHGIESPEERIGKGKDPVGMLKITAFYAGANVIIQVHDDGRGINLEKVRERALEKGYILPDQLVTDQELLHLILEPGFTTRENVSMVSGRGVGMDVVRKELNAIGGSLEIETEKDLGTSITMKLPATLSIIDTLLLEVDQSHVLVPLLEVEYCYKENSDQIYSRNSNYLLYKNDMVPFVSLRQKFNYPAHGSREEMVIILNKLERKFAIVVDDIIGEQQAVIKPLGELFINQPYFSGGSIMVDGNLALVLDTNYLFNQSVLN